MKIILLRGYLYSENFTHLPLKSRSMLLRNVTFEITDSKLYKRLNPVGGYITNPNRPIIRGTWIGESAKHFTNSNDSSYMHIMTPNLQKRLRFNSKLNSRIYYGTKRGFGYYCLPDSTTPIIAAQCLAIKSETGYSDIPSFIPTTVVNPTYADAGVLL